jgi:hypothetical protein
MKTNPASIKVSSHNTAPALILMRVNPTSYTWVKSNTESQ